MFVGKRACACIYVELYRFISFEILIYFAFVPTLDCKQDGISKNALCMLHRDSEEQNIKNQNSQDI